MQGKRFHWAVPLPTLNYHTYNCLLRFTVHLDLIFFARFVANSNSQVDSPLSTFHWHCEGGGSLVLFLTWVMSRAEKVQLYMTVPVVDSGLVKRAKITYYMYSGRNPPYEHPWKAVIYDIADTLFSPKCIYICLWTIKTHSNLVKWRGSPVPTVPELYKIHSIIWTLVFLFRKIVCHIWWIQKRALY